MVDLQGTGNELGRLDLGPFGEFVVIDDGDPDEYVWFEEANSGDNLAVVIQDMRRNNGDDATIDALEELQDRLTADPSEQTGNSDNIGSSFERTGPFVCDGCGKTWPQKSNQKPDVVGENICPECSDSQ